MSTSPKPSARKVRCPGCGVDCVYAIENPYRPFCSARCKNNDFGSWASESFSVDADADADAEVDAGAGLAEPETNNDRRAGPAEPRNH